MSAPTDALVTGWLLARIRGGPVRLSADVPAELVLAVTAAGLRVVVDDAEAMQAAAADPSLVVAATQPTDVAITVATLSDASAVEDPADGPLLTVAVLAGSGALGAEQLPALLADAPWQLADDHLIVGDDRVVWAAHWTPAQPNDARATRLATRLSDAASALAVGTGALRDEVARLDAHARNVEQHLTAARQAAQQAERMHTRLASEVAKGDAGRSRPQPSVAPAGAAEAKAVARKAAGAGVRLARKAASRAVSLAARATGGNGAGPTAGAAAEHSSLGDSTPGRRTGAPFKVGVLGAAADQWLGGYVRTAVVPAAWRGRLVEAADHLEALLVAPDVDGWSDDQLRAIVAEATEADIPVLGLRPDPTVTPWFDGLVDIEIVPDAGAGGPDRVAAARPADASAWHATGWRREPPRRLALLADDELPEAIVDRAADAAGGRDALFVVGDAAVPDGVGTAPPGADDTLLGTLHAARGVLDHPRLHPHPGAHAARLVELALANVSVVCLDLPGSVASLLGDELAAALQATTVADLDDPDQRERRAVACRRAAWRHHTISARWRHLLPRLQLPTPRQPTVSVVLATNRPDHLVDAVRQIDAQTWPGTELVVGMHGDAFGPDAPDTILASTSLPTEIVPVPGDQPLGEVLNRACQAAAGDVVAKWDDDDFYGPEHVVDLLLALEASGATLVGKGSEFVYLADIDVTIRRATRGAHSGSRTMGGGTLAIGRDDLRHVGWWPHVPRAVDQRLMDAVLAHDGTLHRTHGLGFVLHRHGVGHTWAMGTDYFLQHAESQRRGLALEFAGVR